MTRLEIEAFLSICRHKNVSKAAEELFISQSSLSTRLKTLEEFLGCQLLLRGRGQREITLTAQGQAFHDLALQYQEIIRKMEAVGKGDVVEKLRVSVINSVGTYIMPPVFQRFMEKYPHIQLAVQDMEAELACPSIILGKTDLAFTTAKIQTDQIVATPFLSDPMTLICSVDSPYPEVVKLERLDLKNEIYIKWCADHAYWHHATFGTNVLPQVKLELMGQIEPFVAKRDKWTIVPKSVADALKCSPRLRQCTPDFSIPDRRVYILRHRDNAETNNIHCFLEVLRECLREAKVQGVLL